MRFDIISVQPALLAGPITESIVARAVAKKKAEIVVHNLRDFGQGNYKQIDDYPYGGGAGMVLMAEPLGECIEHLMAQRMYDDIIYLTPDGETFVQTIANQLSLKQNLLLICGHYKGIDERIRQKFVTRELSIGDYVLTGGELAAAVVVDAVVRLIPGVIGDESSALTDSFQDGLLSPPVFTRPSDYCGMKVPEVLLGGNEQKIENWRHEEALARTRLRRPDLMEQYNKSE